MNKRKVLRLALRNPRGIETDTMRKNWDVGQVSLHRTADPADIARARELYPNAQMICTLDVGFFILRDSERWPSYQGENLKLAMCANNEMVRENFRTHDLFPDGGRFVNTGGDLYAINIGGSSNLAIGKYAGMYYLDAWAQMVIDLHNEHGLWDGYTLDYHVGLTAHASLLSPGWRDRLTKALRYLSANLPVPLTVNSWGRGPTWRTLARGHVYERFLTQNHSDRKALPWEDRIWSYLGPFKRTADGKTWEEGYFTSLLPATDFGGHSVFVYNPYEGGMLTQPARVNRDMRLAVASYLMGLRTGRDPGGVGGGPYLSIDRTVEDRNHTDGGYGLDPFAWVEFKRGYRSMGLEEILNLQPVDDREITDQRPGLITRKFVDDGGAKWAVRMNTTSKVSSGVAPFDSDIVHVIGGW